MTEQDVRDWIVAAATAKKQAEITTPEPWSVYAGVDDRSTPCHDIRHDDYLMVAQICDWSGCQHKEQDAAFIVAARSNVPLLADAVKALGEELLLVWQILGDKIKEDDKYAEGRRRGIQEIINGLEQAAVAADRIKAENKLYESLLQ